MIQNGFMDLPVQVFLLFFCLNNNVLSVLKQQQDVPLELNWILQLSSRNIDEDEPITLKLYFPTRTIE